ncbi:diguanylate cyclase [Magnetococcus sp. PR-3]|uniref:diguanylate cyclase n=1 Tax=Magnetococcus sp. PR-3 TaxID=3120355 RepID=UPI002FCE4DC3
MRASFNTKQRSLFSTIILVLSLVVGSFSYFIYQEQKDHLSENELQRVQSELELIGDFLTDAMLRHDYVEATQLLDRWHQKHPDISLLKAHFLNGRQLYKQQHSTHDANALMGEKKVLFDENGLILQLAYHRQSMLGALAALQQRLMVFSILMVLLTGSILWYVLFRWTLKPMEKEISRRTQDLQNSISFTDSILNASDTQMVILDEEGCIVKANKAWKQNQFQNDHAPPDTYLDKSYFQYCQSTLAGEQCEEKAETGIRQVLLGERESFVFDYECANLKARRWYNMRVHRVQWPGAIRVVISHENITNIKLVQEALEANRVQMEILNRHYRVLSQCQMVISQSTEEQALLDQVCKIITEQGGYALAWVGMADRGIEKKVRPVAYQGFQKAYMDRLEVYWDDSALGRGPVGSAIRENRPVIIEDTSTDPRFKPWQDQAKTQQFVTCAAFPLCGKEGCFGALTVYSQDMGAFAAEEASLLSELAANLSLGIKNLRGQTYWDRTRHALEESEQRLSKVVESSPVPMLMRDVNGISINAAFSEVFGYTSEDLQSEAHWWNLAAPEPEMLEGLLKVWNSDGSDPSIYEKVHESRIRCRGGRLRDVQFGLRHVGDITLMTLSDITPIRHHERELSRLLDTLDENVLITRTDLEGNIVYVSSAFSRICGYTKHELLGQNHSILRHTSMSASAYDTLWDTIQSGQQWQGELLNRRKNGESFWVKVRIFPWYDDEGAMLGYASIREDITDRKNVERLSITDKLTQLYNRLKLDEVLKEEVARCFRYKGQLSIILMDLDHFKSVNDTHGHQVGDAVLVDIGGILRDQVRRNDVVGRWGGEEFMVISPETGDAGVLALAEKLRSAIEAYEFPVVGHKTASFGVAVYDLGEKEKSLVARADAALYTAKTQGRNLVVM